VKTVDIALFTIAAMFLKIGTIRQTFGHTSDVSGQLAGAILCVILILILTPFNIEKYMENLCQCRCSMLA